jgi:hypothetical protein
VLRVALDRLDQVGDQVVPALERGLDLGPGVVDRVAFVDQPVVGQPEEQRGEDEEPDDDDQDDHRLSLVLR